MPNSACAGQSFPFARLGQFTRTQGTVIPKYSADTPAPESRAISRSLYLNEDFVDFHIPTNRPLRDNPAVKACPTVSRAATVLVVAISFFLMPVRAGQPPAFQVWSVDPLLKVFRDAAPASSGPAVAEVARGESASLQIVVRADQSIRGLRSEVSPLRRSWGGGALQPKGARFVGYVPVDRPTQQPSEDQLRAPPADYPDPLLETGSMDVGPGQAQPIWITVPIPTNASTGTYRGTLKLQATIAGQPVRAEQKLAIVVYRAVAGPAKLWVTEWYGLQWRHMQIAPQPESEEYYALLRRYARNMAEHRHNVALISPLALGKYTVDPRGELQIDFSRFDSWVEIFQQEGVIGRIEGGHIGGRNGGWESEFAVTVHQVQNRSVVTRQVDPAGPEAQAFYSRFFPALVTHLRSKDWLKRYIQHLADEPIAHNISSYRAMAALARKCAPELRIIEACHTKDLIGSIDIWVPQLNYLHDDWTHYQERQRAGEEVWFYTCVFPQGEYANRFLEQPLIKTRLLHWINARYGVTGYLHWGYNQWTADSPFTHTTRPHGGPPYLPAGDPWIVYPGTNGPLDSIRFEAMRDGIADYALVQALAQKNPATAQALAAKLIQDFDRYNTDVFTFRSVRRELLKRLSQQD